MARRRKREYEQVPPSHSAPPPGALVSAFFRKRFGYRCLRPNGAGSWLLFFTQSGRGLIRQPQVDRVQRPGDAALLAPDAYSDYGVTAGARDWGFHWIHFLPPSEWRAWQPLPEVGRGLFHARIIGQPARARIRGAFERIHQDLLAGDRAARRLVEAALEEIFLVIGRAIGAGGQPMDPRVAEALGRVRRDLTARHTVASLAAAAGLSPSRFAHLFKEETGQSVVQAILALRLEQARRLLSFTEERISDVGYAVGMDSPYYFSRKFKQLVGTGPRGYRAAVRGPAAASKRPTHPRLPPRRSAPGRPT